MTSPKSKPSRNETGTEEGVLIRKIVGGQPDLFGDIRFPLNRTGLQ
jgi:hypothetical protein